nr:enoyl-CoA hydratase-related protein [Actinokineospora bangkokensis]
MRTEPGVLRVVLERPVVNDVVIGDIGAALDRAEADPGVRAVVLTGGGGGVFCEGMDFAAADAGATGGDGAGPFFDLLHRFTTTRLVVVAQVDGRVAGGGVGLVAASDFVHATPASTFSLPEALWGLLPCTVLPFLIRRVGQQAAYAATLSTQAVDAAAAHRVRLVDEVTERPDAALRQLVFRLARLPQEVVGDAKRYFAALAPVDVGVRATAVAEFARLMDSPAVRERISAFVHRGRYPWER